MEIEGLEFVTIEGDITGLDDTPLGAIEKETPGAGGEDATKDIKQTRDVIEDGNEILDFNALEDNIKGEGDKPSSSSSDNLHLNFAKALTESGVIDEFDDSIFTGDDVDPIKELISLVKGTVDNNVDEYRNKVTGTNLEALLKLERGESIEEYLKVKNDNLKLDSITNEDLEDDSKSSLREKVIRDYYKETTNLSDTRIEKSIKRLQDLGEDVEESISMAEELKGIREEKGKLILEQDTKARLAREKSFSDQLEGLRADVDNTDLSFLSSNVTKKTRDKLYNMLTQPVSKDSNLNAVTTKRNELGANKFDVTLAYLIDKGVFDGDLSKISSKQKRTAIDNLAETMKRKSDYSAGHGGNFGSSNNSTADEIFGKKRY